MQNVAHTPHGQSRSVVIARNGMVAAGHPLAAAAGLHVLQSGGNAVDAAVATAGVLGVVQPMMSGLGGDTFALVWLAAQRKVYALNGSGIAPYAATREWFTSRGYTKMPLRGMLSVSVPGAVDALVTALDRWGSGKFALSELLIPAIDYADDGYPVAPKVAFWIASVADIIAKFPSTAKIYLPQGRTPNSGEVLVNKDLARSLRAVASGGKQEFYRGDLARRLTRYCLDQGGLMTERDLAEHGTEVYEPIKTTYRGLTVCTTKPPSQGYILLEMLNILEAFTREDLRWGAPQAIHLMVEAKKLAFADRLAYMGDPKFVRNPLDELLSKDHAARRRQQIDLDRAQRVVSAGALTETVGDTTYVCAADTEGNVVSFVTSLSARFGCGEIIEGTGIMLNNRAGRGFSLDPGHPNCIAPGKRTMHTLIPVLALREEAPYLAWGNPGGDAQPQWNMQILSDIVDSGFEVQAAVEAPRWFSFPGTDPANLPAPFVLRVEEGFPAATLARLAELGHIVREMGDVEAYGAQVIMVQNGMYHGGSDPRVDGCASGY